MTYVTITDIMHFHFESIWNEAQQTSAYNIIIIANVLLRLLQTRSRVHAYNMVAFLVAYYVYSTCNIAGYSSCTIMLIPIIIASQAAVAIEKQSHGYCVLHQQYIKSQNELPYLAIAVQQLANQLTFLNPSPAPRGGERDWLDNYSYTLAIVHNTFYYDNIIYMTQILFATPLPPLENILATGELDSDTASRSQLCMH